MADIDFLQRLQDDIQDMGFDRTMERVASFPALDPAFSPDLLLTFVNS